MLVSRKIQSALIFLLALFEGGVFVLLPVGSTVLTNVYYSNYSFGQYGVIFLSLSIGGLVAALLTASYTEKKGIYRPFVLAMLCHLLSLYFFGMVILFTFSPFSNFLFLTTGTFLLGIGIATNLTLINALITLLFVTKRAQIITFFYGAIGVGGLLFSLLLRLALKIQFVTIVPLILVLGFIFLFFLFDFFIPLKIETEVKETPKVKGGALFLISLFFFGMAETLITNWTRIYTLDYLHLTLSQTQAIYLGYLIFFTLSRFIFGFLFGKNLTLFYWLIPLLLVITLMGAAMTSNASLALVLFSTLGFLISPLLPLIISFAIENNPNRYVKVSGMTIAIFILGFGVGSFVFGQIETQNLMHMRLFLPLAALFSLGILIANCATLLKRSNNGPD